MDGGAWEATVHGVAKSQTRLSDSTQSLPHIYIHTYVHVCMRCVLYLVAQLCLTLCDPMDSSPSGSSVHGILQARIWSGLPFAPPGDLPDPGIEPRSLALQADSLPSESSGKL